MMFKPLEVVQSQVYLYSSSPVTTTSSATDLLIRPVPTRKRASNHLVDIKLVLSTRDAQSSSFRFGIAVLVQDRGQLKHQR
jgi:hypothetical protein